MKKKFHKNKNIIPGRLLLLLLLIFLLPLIFWASQYPQLIISLGKNFSGNLKPLQASSVSQSKLGAFYINATDGGRKVAQAGPKVIKVMDPQDNGGLMELVREYKRNYPGGIVVMRVYEGDTPGYGVNSNPEQSAEDFWNKLLGPATSKLTASDKQLITYLSGPNEYGNTPAITTSTEASWTARFWAKLAQIMAQNGFRPLLGEIPVGNLDGDLMPNFIPALRTIKSLGGAWSYHAYSNEYTTDPGVEIWYSLRYRRFYDYIRENAPDLSDMPMILTEGGIDHSGNGKTDGWNGTLPPRGDRDLFLNWLTWFDGEIQNDPYILGVTLSQIGNNTDWSSFNLEPISDWLAGYIGEEQDTNAPTLPPIVTTAPPTARPSPVLTVKTVTPVIIASPTSVPTQPPQALPPTLTPAVTFISKTPLPSSTLLPSPTVTPSPAPLIDIGKTIKTAQAFWRDILLKFDNFSRIILP